MHGTTDTAVRQAPVSSKIESPNDRSLGLRAGAHKSELRTTALETHVLPKAKAAPARCLFLHVYAYYILFRMA